MSGLDELIARLEKATGPDRELDCYIHAEALRREAESRVVVVGLPTYDEPRFFFNPDKSIHWVGYDLLNVSPRYTSSIDAALTLVPKDWRVEISGVNASWFVKLNYTPYAPGTPDHQWFAPSPALALCIAALKARAPNLPEGEK